MKTPSVVALISLSLVSLAACGGQVNGPAVEGDGSGSGSSDGSGLGSEGSGEGSTGYATGSYGSGYGYGTTSEYGSGSGYGGSSGYGTTSYGYGSTGGYGSGSGIYGCGDLPPSGIACGLPAGCTGGLVCEGGTWTCEVFSCQSTGQCEGDAPYCVDGCGNYESSYCDGDGNWACPATPPCNYPDAGGPADTGTWIGEDAGVIGVPLPR